MTDTHIPNAELVVWYKGKEHMILNRQLLDQQNCWDKLDLIKSLHVVRLYVEDAMEENLDNDLIVANLHLSWDYVQFMLQEAWGFPRNIAYHRFWDIPACTCPKMDNNDRYPTGIYITTEDCPLHGEG